LLSFRFKTCKFNIFKHPSQRSCDHSQAASAASAKNQKNLPLYGTIPVLPPHNNTTLSYDIKPLAQPIRIAMNHNHLLHLSSRFKRVGAALLVTLAAAVASHAQGVTGQIFGTPSTMNPGDYSYTATFDNTGSASIAFIWFSWTPATIYGDLMAQSPLDVQTPSDWNANVYTYFGPPYDGYSIQFTANDAGLAPNHSVTFTFDSPLTPTQIEATSAYAGGYYSTLYSYYYQTTSETGAAGAFVVSLVPAPEPSTFGLLALGGIGLIFAARRYVRRPTPEPVAR
jgi:PEP-CTERM motif